MQQGALYTSDDQSIFVKLKTQPATMAQTVPDVLDNNHLSDKLRKSMAEYEQFQHNYNKSTVGDSTIRNNAF